MYVEQLVDGLQAEHDGQAFAEAIPARDEVLALHTKAQTDSAPHRNGGPHRHTVGQAKEQHPLQKQPLHGLRHPHEKAWPH
eukprot:12891757-Prorocentrum_lima.AAC.1